MLSFVVYQHQFLRFTYHGVLITCNSIRTRGWRRQTSEVLPTSECTTCRVDTSVVQWISKTQTTFFINPQFYFHASSSKVALWVAGWGVSYVTSLKGYRSMCAFYIQPWLLHVYMAAASHNSFSKRAKYSLY
jgi:hypothetical protein